MQKIVTNYHTHTTLCGHAYLEDNENYVKEAINNNFKILGISDHEPFKNIIHPKMRMNFDSFNIYLNMVDDFKNKYKDKITILKGLEIEYYKDKDTYYKELLKDYKLDYLILGQHCYYNDDKVIFYYKEKDDIEGIKKYVEDIINGINSGYFSYVCHPDLFLQNVSKWNEEIAKYAKKIILASNKMSLPLEININGFINGLIYGKEYFKYPDINFFKLAKSLNSKFIFGIDAHHSIRLKDENIPYNELDKFLKETNITDNDIIKELKLINPYK